MIPMTSLAIHFQFEIADSAASASRMCNGANSFASPTPVQAWCVRGLRAKKCRSAGKSLKCLHKFYTGVLMLIYMI
jgi:hypothetical protein